MRAGGRGQAGGKRSWCVFPYFPTLQPRTGLGLQWNTGLDVTRDLAQRLCCERLDSRAVPIIVFLVWLQNRKKNKQTKVSV